MQVAARDELAALFNNNMRAVKAFEALGLDVSGTLPDASLANAEAAEGAQATADQAVLDAAAAQSTADQAVLDAAAAQATADAAQVAADAAQADIDAHEALTAAHGTTGAVVGTTDTQTLTNKTFGSALVLTGQTVNTGGNTPTLGANLPGPGGDPRELHGSTVPTNRQPKSCLCDLADRPDLARLSRSGPFQRDRPQRYPPVGLVTGGCRTPCSGPRLTLVP